MQVLSVTNLPIYLPGDAAFNPFGDPLVATMTIAAPGVVTVQGYNPTNGDQVAFSTTGALPGGIVAGANLFVVASSGGTFEVSLTKGGAAITTTGSQSGVHSAHFTTNDAGLQNIILPFKPGNSVLVFNPSASGLILQGAADTGTGFGEPAGPGSFSTILTCGAAVGFYGPAQLGFDWIRVSTSATLQLVQN